MSENITTTLAQRHVIIIGIDTGTNTGIAVSNKPERKFLQILSLPIHRAMELVLKYHQQHGAALFVRFEDARLRKWLKDKSPESLQGAGSIKRDCTIWDDFLKDHGVHYASIGPRAGLTKIPADKFSLITGWEGKTNNHARDAAMLVYGY